VLSAEASRLHPRIGLARTKPQAIARRWPNTWRRRVLAGLPTEKIAAIGGVLFNRLTVNMIKTIENA